MQPDMSPKVLPVVEFLSASIAVKGGDYVVLFLHVFADPLLARELFITSETLVELH